MPQITKEKLIKALNKYSKEDLIEQIVELFSKSEFVKDYYSDQFSTKSNIVSKYKKLIKHEFESTWGEGLANIQLIRKSIKEFEKLSSSDEDKIDLWLYFTDYLAKFIDAFGDGPEEYYDYIEEYFDKSVKSIAENKLQIKYEARCKAIVNKTRDCGYGIGDITSDTYKDNFKSKNRA